MKVGGCIDGLCPFCKQFVVTGTPRKFVYWGNPDTGAKAMWRVAHIDCKQPEKVPPMNVVVFEG